MDFTKLAANNLTEAVALVKKVFDEFEAQEYSPEGVATFYAHLEQYIIPARLEKGPLQMWGAFENGRLIGVIALENHNHVALLFVDKQYHRQGVATQLFHLVMAYCIQKNIKQITVNSAPYAVSIYQRLGFVALDAEQVKNGIRFVPMLYKI